jgi:hypothetical protein
MTACVSLFMKYENKMEKKNESYVYNIFLGKAIEAIKIKINIRKTGNY